MISFTSSLSWSLQRYFVLWFLLAISISSDNPLKLPLSEILNSDLLRQHSYSPPPEEDWHAALRSDDLKLLCGRTDQIGLAPTMSSHFVFSNSKEGIFCSLTTDSSENLPRDLQVIPLPHPLKVHPNILSYLKNTSSYLASPPLRSLFVIQFTPNTAHSLRALARGIFDLEHLSTGPHLKQLLRRGVSEWSDLVAGAILQLLPDEESFSTWSHLNRSLSQHCSVYGTLRALIGAASHDDDFGFAERIKIEVYGNSVHIHGLPDPLISPTCVAVLAHSASLSPFVFSVSFGDDFGFVNADGSSSVQGDRMGLRAYHDAGLTGSGQIGGIADSGVNDLSCFFADNSEMYRTRSTSRTWGIESFRRKIIQYVPYADSVDDEGGHGTHTCGTLAGESLSVFSEENGVAPGAKIAFFDIGYSMAAIPIMIPRLSSVLFPTAYAAGARVHSNSWAGGLTLYTEYSLEVDSYLYENPDFLVVLAAGNRGMFGPGSIGSPANSKNALCVGSTQIRNPVDDSLGSAGPVVSATSSLGPTFDGRIKPDILAVGEGVVSAYSTSVDLQYEAQHMRYSLWSQRDLDHLWASLSSCSVHEKSGTSMATPLVAGSALLIRQYFSDPRFWASLCEESQLWCKSFEPSGYLLKALILHGGEGVAHHSDPETSPPFPLGPPPDLLQGYGAFGLQRILPLRGGQGLPPPLNLVVFDQLLLPEHSVFRFHLDFQPNSSGYPLKVTVCWFDPPSLVGWVSHLLIHDIDIALVAPISRDRDSRDQEVSWGNNVTGGDSLNPNEQIFVFHPRCPPAPREGGSAPPCRYSLLLRSHALPFKRLQGDGADNSQPLALVLTTSASVSGPEKVSLEAWLSPQWQERSSVAEEAPIPPPPRVNQVPPSPSATLPSNDSRVVIDFFSVPLEVSQGGAEYVHSVVPIAAFEEPHWGRLDSVTLRLAPQSIPPPPLRPFPLLGLDAFLLTVTVVDPNGLATEIGGFDWPTRSDDFYLRLWPTTWTSRTSSASDEWRATRNVSSSGLGRDSLSLSSSYRSDTLPFPFSPLHAGPGVWVVSLSVGFRYGVRPLVHYSGTVILHFQQSSSRDPPSSCSSTTSPPKHTAQSSEQAAGARLHLSYFPESTAHHRHGGGSGEGISSRDLRPYALSALALSALILLSVFLCRSQPQDRDCAGQRFPPLRRGSQELPPVSSRAEILLHERSPLLPRSSLEEPSPRQERGRYSS